MSRVGTLLLRRERLLSDAGLLAAGVRFTYGRGRSRRALLHCPLLGQQDLLLLGRHYWPLRHFFSFFLAFFCFPLVDVVKPEHTKWNQNNFKNFFFVSYLRWNFPVVVLPNNFVSICQWWGEPLNFPATTDEITKLVVWLFSNFLILLQKRGDLETLLFFPFFDFGSFCAVM